MNKKDSHFSRRNFLKSSALGIMGTTVATPAFLSSCSGQGSGESKLKDVVVPEILASAPDGKPLKAGLVGCGG
ncbi:MAG: hypothetical protein LBS42_09510, partial [Tannerella sp.]|nr:hypothetical protein [Tannerella sp.]